MEKCEETIQHLQALLGDNKFYEIFEMLNDKLKSGSHCFGEMILLKGRFNNLIIEIVKGTISNKDQRTELNHIRNALLELIKKIDCNDMTYSIDTKRGVLIKSPEERTKEIIEHLERLLNTEPNTQNVADIWSLSFLSILAIDDDDPSLKNQHEYRRLLLKEKKLFIELAERNFKIKCVISPASQYSIRVGREDIKRAIHRTKNLIKLLKSGESYLRNIEWTISQYDFENRYIIGSTSMFIGLRYGLEVGYGITYVSYDKAYISLKKHFYELIFKDTTALMHVKWGNKNTIYKHNHDLTREAIINCLEDSLNFLKGL